MKQKKVSIIIVNWNGKNHLMKCLPSVFKQDYKNIEVILVDNGSHDNSISYVRKYFHQVRIIEIRENLGFAEGNNRGYKVSSGDYILFLNNDTTVTEQAFSSLVSVLESNPKIGGVQSKINFMDDKTRLDTVGSFLTWTGFLYHYGFAKKDAARYNTQTAIYSAKGASMMFKKEVLQKVLIDGNIFDEQYFAYFEETDMCHRVWLAGYEIVFVPQSVIYHKIGATSSKLDNAFVQYHSFKNRIHSYCKNLGIFYLIPILTLHLILCQFIALFSLFKANWGVFFAIQKAFIWNVTRFGDILRKRSIVQGRIRQLDDHQFMARIMRRVPVLYYAYVFWGRLDKYID